MPDINDTNYKFLLHDGEEMTVAEMKDEIHRLRKITGYAPARENTLSVFEYAALQDAEGDYLEHNGTHWVSGPEPSEYQHTTEVVRGLVDNKMLTWGGDGSERLVVTAKGSTAVDSYKE